LESGRLARVAAFESITQSMCDFVCAMLQLILVASDRLLPIRIVAGLALLVVIRRIP
jgi:hypothetical protein